MAREDPHLVPPEPPDSVPTLGLDPSGLAIATPAGPGPLVVEGERVTVLGSQRGAIERVLIDGRLAARDVRSDEVTMANVVVWPGLVRRECAGPRGVSFESALAAPRLPLAAIQWGSAKGPVPDSISVDLPLPHTAATYGVDGRSCAVVDSEGRMVAVGFSPEPIALDVSEETPGYLSVRIRPAIDRATTLLIAGGAPDAVTHAFRAARHLSAHARQASDATLDDGLALATGVAELDDGIHWARCRLRAALSRAAAAPAGAGADAFWASVAALAVGDQGAATHGLQALRAVDGARAAVIAGGFATTLGGSGAALDAADSLLRAASGTGPAGDAEGSAWHRLALESLARSLHNAAPPELIAALRAAAGEDPGGGAAGDEVLERDEPGVQLPVVGRQVAPRLTDWLPSLLAGEPESPTPACPSSEETAICALAASFRTNPDEGWRAWRASIAQGMSAGPAGPGSWDGSDRASPVVAPVTASLLIGLAHGLMGSCPDALTGRIRIAPRLPAHVTRFGARGLTVGQTRLTLTYEADGPAHRFTLEPTSAAVPPTVVFEPGVPGVVTRVEIDGTAADLETRRAGDRTIVAVQLPVDAPRSVEIVTR